MRRPPKEDGANMDSLLDALTNVVGILIIMLVVALLGMSEAVKRISQVHSDREISVEDLADKKEQLDALRALLGELDPKWLALKARKPQEQVNLAKLRQEIEQLLKEVGTVSADKVDMVKLKQDFAEREAQANALEKKLTDSVKRIALLKAQLDDTPEQKVLPPQVIKIPNPRDAPKGATPIQIVAHGNRMILVDVTRYQKKIESYAKRYAKRAKLIPEGPTNYGGLNGPEFLKRIEKIKFGDRNWDVQPKIYGRRLYLDFVLAEKGGSDPAHTAKPTSRIYRAIKKAKRHNQYCQFYIWPDSYEVYTKARDICDKAGIAAGWYPRYPHQKPDWRQVMDPRLLFDAPKPKPRPKSTAPPPKKPAVPVRPPLRNSPVD